VAVVGGLSISLWHDGWVDKAELVMESKPDDGFLRARCSACPNVRFDLTGNTLSQKVLMRKMFDAHLQRVHMDKDSVK
jgi:hypothetical protein